jgi:hypothetical protein
LVLVVRCQLIGLLLFVVSYRLYVIHCRLYVVHVQNTTIQAHIEDSYRRYCNSTNNDNRSLWQLQKCIILQYIKHQDQHMILISLLLKVIFIITIVVIYPTGRVNKWFVRSTPKAVKSKQIIVLPRTMYNQPYVTKYKTIFSISHRYPIVGLIQQQQ